jgi:hypothetical protein
VKTVTVGILFNDILLLGMAAVCVLTKVGENSNHASQPEPTTPTSFWLVDDMEATFVSVVNHFRCKTVCCYPGKLPNRRRSVSTLLLSPRISHFGEQVFDLFSGDGRDILPGIDEDEYVCTNSYWG